MKHFYGFIVVDKDEASADCSIIDYEYDDYRYWGLYDMDTKKLVFFGDNIHNGAIDDEIEAFLRGIDYVGANYSFETGYVVLDDLTYVNQNDVLTKLNNGEMIDEVL
jgi:hypothetical protein